MTHTELTDYSNYQAITEKVRSGEFFQEGRQMYDLMVHDSMTERYLHVLIVSLALVVFTTTLLAMQMLYPLSSAVPFIVNSNNLAEEVPRITTLLNYKGEKPSDALLRYVVRNYVIQREEYHFETFDRNANGVKAQSSEDVKQTFQTYVDPQINADSPYNLYQRHSRRKISILSSKSVKNQDHGMEVYFEAILEGKGEVKKSRWQANIAFNYSGIEIDQETGKVDPITFLVTNYKTKRLQDVQ